MKAHQCWATHIFSRWFNENSHKDIGYDVTKLRNSLFCRRHRRLTERQRKRITNETKPMHSQKKKRKNSFNGFDTWWIAFVQSRTVWYMHCVWITFLVSCVVRISYYDYINNFTTTHSSVTRVPLLRRGIVQLNFYYDVLKANQEKIKKKLKRKTK